MSALKYSLPSMHKSTLHVKYAKQDKTHVFYPIFNPDSQTYNESNNKDHMHCTQK